MLPLELGGVVSNEQKVYNVRGLRVADISAWPFQLSGAPMATVYASAERVSLSFLGSCRLDRVLTVFHSSPISSRRNIVWLVLAELLFEVLGLRAKIVVRVNLGRFSRFLVVFEDGLHKKTALVSFLPCPAVDTRFDGICGQELYRRGKGFAIHAGIGFMPQQLRDG